MGASVTGIDLGEDLIQAAKSLSAQAGVHIDFQVGDAEKLSFEDKSFDVVLSTFGVMFVQRPEAAAAELARVCRKNGRLGLLTWLPDSTTAGFFKVMKKYIAIPPNPPPSPFEWGDRKRVTQLLASAFDLKFETGVSYVRQPSGQALWELMVTGYGPTKTLAANLNDEQRKSLMRDFIAYHEQYHTELGIAMPREYLVTIGVRK
jgi:SAM-dependent methyltransferase